MEYQYGKTQSIWADTTEKWDDAHPSWKTVGASPRRVSKESFGNDLDIPRRASIENLFVCEDTYYILTFPSGREMIGSSRTQHNTGEYVIIEADRGEDCAYVREQIQLDEEALQRHSGTCRCQRMTRTKICEQIRDAKKILRPATENDVDTLEVRGKQELSALEKCVSLVNERGYPMVITRCEFQWDMRKITFYFRSNKRVDFRDLVKELFKYFKIRIWMSMENRGTIEGRSSYTMPYSDDN
ncbi:hypothetical protein PAEPH01_1785 [Pancytospora epiphaga]|nr:hypothetical protein PAEPH01_1785 [Pancytospora epiphaga]